MVTNARQEAVELLQELGLKEYEAKTFVALARMPTATAKEVASNSEVPRTRVYDAIRVLEAKGLVEIQHRNPQEFRAVPIDEAVETIERDFGSRIDSLETTLRRLDPVSPNGSPSTHEVWSLAAPEAITIRTKRLVEDANDEVVMIVGTAELLTDELLEVLEEATDRGVSVLVGVEDPAESARVQDSLHGARVFESGLDWLSETDSESVAIGFMLMIDRESMLISTTKGGDLESAVYGSGFENGFVVITRRMLATGLIPFDDSGSVGGASTEGTDARD